MADYKFRLKRQLVSYEKAVYDFLRICFTFCAKISFINFSGKSDFSPSGILFTDLYHLYADGTLERERVYTRNSEKFGMIERQQFQTTDHNLNYATFYEEYQRLQHEQHLVNSPKYCRGESRPAGLGPNEPLPPKHARLPQPLKVVKSSKWRLCYSTLFAPDWGTDSANSIAAPADTLTPPARTSRPRT